MAKPRRSRSSRPSAWALVAGLVFVAGVGALAVTALQNRPANDASGASGVLANGTTAPDVTLASTTGTTVRLADLRGKRNVLLYFYEHAG